MTAFYLVSYHLWGVIASLPVVDRGVFDCGNLLLWAGFHFIFLPEYAKNSYFQPVMAQYVHNDSKPKFNL